MGKRKTNSEGRYTKAGTIFGLLALLITIWQLIPSKNYDMTGEWGMTSIVESSEMKKYIGSKIEWRLFLTQAGNSIKGSGEKIAINREQLDFNQRTKILIEGKIEGNSFSLNYTEKGSLRETCGRFYGNLSSDNFNGLFSQTASDAKGKIKGLKIIN